MIITCPNCKKQFKIDNSLLSNEGRDLQCGSCTHVWFYKIQEENNKAIKLNDEIISKDIEIKKQIKEEKNRSQEIIDSKTRNERKVKISEKQNNPPISKNLDNKGSKFFSYLIVFVISFVALIILIDTLKTPLISIIPGLETILFNLFETLQDIKLFIIDLV